MCRLHEQRVLSAEHAPDVVEMDLAHENCLDEATYMGCKYLTSSQVKIVDYDFYYFFSFLLCNFMIQHCDSRSSLRYLSLSTITSGRCFRGFCCRDNLLCSSKTAAPAVPSLITTNAAATSAAAATTAKLEEDLRLLQGRILDVMKVRSKRPLRI